MRASEPKPVWLLHIQLVAIAVLSWLLAATAFTQAFAADNFPPLTGRVVDNAGLLQADAKQRLDGKLADLESKSGIQLVVATLPSLNGQEIEPVANALFRFWKLGEAKQNNGVLLLVAPKERKVRIEVGYGEEGTLTDALSKVIITNAIVPRFKTGDFQGGIERGVEDIITVLTTDSSDWQKRPSLRQDTGDSADTLAALLPLLIFAIVVFVIIRSARRSGGGRLGGSPWIVPPMGGGSWGGGSGGGFSGGGGGGGGGFSGGGGSSGGGGASGSW